MCIKIENGSWEIYMSVIYCKEIISDFGVSSTYNGQLAMSLGFSKSSKFSESGVTTTIYFSNLYWSENWIPNPWRDRKSIICVKYNKTLVHQIQVRGKWSKEQLHYTIDGTHIIGATNCHSTQLMKEVTK